MSDFMQQLGAGWRHAPLGPVTETSTAARASILATYRGPGRDRVLQAFERLSQVPQGTAALARQADPLTVGRAVYGAYGAAGGTAAAAATSAVAADAAPVSRTLGMVASGAGEAAVNPVYQGLMAQLLWLPPGVARQAADGGAGAAAAAGQGVQRMSLGLGAAGSAAAPVTGGGASAAGDAAHGFAPAGANGPALAWGAGIGAFTGLMMGRDNSGLAIGLGIGGGVLGATMLKGASASTGYGLLGFGAALAVTGLLLSGPSGPSATG